MGKLKGGQPERKIGNVYRKEATSIKNTVSDHLPHLLTILRYSVCHNYREWLILTPAVVIFLVRQISFLNRCVPACYAGSLYQNVSAYIPVNPIVFHVFCTILTLMIRIA